MIDLVRIPQEEIQTITELINIQVDNMQVILPCFLLIENQIDNAGEFQQFKYWAHMCVFVFAFVCDCACFCACVCVSFRLC